MYTFQSTPPAPTIRLHFFSLLHSCDILRTTGTLRGPSFFFRNPNWSTFSNSGKGVALDETPSVHATNCEAELVATELDTNKASRAVLNTMIGASTNHCLQTLHAEFLVHCRHGGPLPSPKKKGNITLQQNRTVYAWQFSQAQGFPFAELLKSNTPIMVLPGSLNLHCSKEPYCWHH